MSNYLLSIVGGLQTLSKSFAESSDFLFSANVLATKRATFGVQKSPESKDKIKLNKSSNNTKRVILRFP